MQVSVPYTTTITFGADQRAAKVGLLVDITPKDAFVFECGEVMETITLAYQTYGTLNAKKTNAILICHGLTGDQYIAGVHPVTGKRGWWEMLVGPGNVFDTDRYFMIVSNVLGGCMGSLGPKSRNAATGKPYGLNFPVVTVGDMVRAQALLMDALGIDSLFAVIGGSMGGMLALEWAVRFPERMKICAPIATSARHSPQNIAFHEIGRQAVMADPNWRDGNYESLNCFPTKGLAVARMTAHVTYLSETVLQHKFGRKLQDKSKVSYGFESDFQVESYLRHQGASFVERFDPNSYLYITRAMDYFDLESEFEGQLARAFAGHDTRYCVMSFSSDWLFTTADSKRMVRAMNAAGVRVSFTEIHTDKGHDAFLLDEPVFHATLRGFLTGMAREEGLI